MEIEVWYGAGDRTPMGPLEAVLVEEKSEGKVRFRITDKGWFVEVGWDERIDGPMEFTYEKLPPSHFVWNDAYAWCPKGESGMATTKWW